MLTYITYSDLVRDVEKLALSIPSETVRRIRAVVGIPRSGMLPATMLAHHWNVPLANYDGQLLSGDRTISWTSGCGDTLLLVDDAIYRGTAMDRAAALIPADHRLVRAAVYSHPDAPTIDFIGRVVPARRYFAWNLFGHADAASFAFDLDGVLCLDPPVRDDDGPEYEQALVNAVPWKLPSVKVGAIVTMRLERWRAVTEDWLSRHGVQYGELVMCPCNSADQRRSSFGRYGYGKWKGKQATFLGLSLFVESDESQASEINATSGMMVICPTTGRYWPC